MCDDLGRSGSPVGKGAGWTRRGCGCPLVRAIERSGVGARRLRLDRGLIPLAANGLVYASWLDAGCGVGVRVNYFATEALRFLEEFER